MVCEARIEGCGLGICDGGKCAEFIKELAGTILSGFKEPMSKVIQHFLVRFLAGGEYNFAAFTRFMDLSVQPYLGYRLDTEAAHFHRWFLLTCKISFLKMPEDILCRR